ncbi:MAG: SdrD B-like domain-containing protein [Rhodothermales bacterium]
MASRLAGETAGGSWSIKSGAPGANFDAFSGMLDPNNLAAGVYEFTYTVAANGDCPGDSEDLTITINPTPDLSTTNATICNGSSQNLALLVTDNASASGTFTYYETAGAAATGGAGIASTVSPTSNETYYIRSTTTNGCFDIASVDVDVNSTVSAGAGSTANVCEAPSGLAVISLASLLTGESGGGTWTSTGANAGVQFDAFTGVLDPNGLATGTYVFNYAVAASAPCPADNEDVTVIVNASPDLSTIPDTICNDGASSVNLATTVTDNAATTGTFSYHSSLAGAQSGTTDILPTVVVEPTATTTYYIRKEAAAGCFDVVDVEIVVNQPANAGTALAAANICFTASGLPTISLDLLLNGENAGGSWALTSGTPGSNFDAFTGTLDPNNLTAGTYTFTYTVTGVFPCPNDAEVVTIIINPTPDLAVNAATICNGSSIDLATLVSDNASAGGTLTYYNSLGDAQTPTGSLASSTVGPTSNQVYYVRSETSNGCFDIEAISITVSNTVSAGTATPLSQCYAASGLAVVDLADQLAGESTGGTWALTSGAPGSAFDAFTGTLDPNGLAAGVYTFTYTVAGGGTCPNDDEVVSVTINATPDLTTTPDTICNDGGSSVNLSTLVVDNATTGGTLTFYDDLADAQTPTGALASSTVTPTTTTTYYIRSDATGGCFDIEAVTIQVNNPVTAGTGSTQTQCYAASGQAIIDLTNLLSGETAGGSWALTTGAPGSAFDAFTGSLDPNGLAAGTYTFTYTVTGATPCPNDNEVVTVTINASPDLATMPGTICNGGSIDLATLVVDNASAGGTLTYYNSLADANTPTGAIASTVSPGTTTTYYVRSDATGGCFDIATIDVNVNQTVTAGTGSTANFCYATSGLTVQDLADLLTGETAGGSWTIKTGSPGSSFDAFTGTLDPNGLAVGTYVFTYTIGATPPCTPDDEDVTVIINATPDLVGTPISICNGGSADLSAQVTDNASAGGTLSYYATLPLAMTGNAADALPSGTVSPSSSFTYYVRSETTPGCFDVAAVAVTVNQTVTAGLGSSQNVCEAPNGLSTITLDNLLAGETAGGSWAIKTGNPGANFDAFTGVLDPNGLATGTYVFTYTVTGTAPCPNDDEDVTVVVNTVPDLITNDATVCNDGNQSVDMTTLVTDNNSAGGTLTFYSDLATAQSQGTAINASQGPITTTTYYVRSQTSANCFDIASLTINVNQPVTAGTGGSTPLCFATSGLAVIDLATNLSGETAGGAWTLKSGAPGTAFDAFTGTFDPNNVAAGTYVFTYTVTGTAPCPNDDEDVTIIINNTPDLVTTPLTVCAGTVVDLATRVTDNNSAGGTITYHNSLADAGNPTTDIGASQTITATKTFYIRSQTSSSCFDIESVTITSDAQPVASNGAISQCASPPGAVAATFNLASANTQVDPTGSYVVTYHLTSNAAMADVGALPSAYLSMNAVIFARVENGTTGCYDVSQVALTVSPTPAAQPGALTECSTVPGGTTADFTLSAANAQVDPAGTNTVSYHITQAQANNDASPLGATYNTSGATLFARVENGACFTTAPVTLTVNTVPAANPAILSACAALPGGTMAMFNLLSLNTTVDPTGSYLVTYHANQINANSGNFPLSPVYFSASTTIYARVANGTCFSTNAVVLNVVQQPIANPVSVTACTDAAGGTTATVNLISLISQIDMLGGNVVTFHTNPNDAVLDQNAITMPNAYVTGTTVLYSRIEVPGGACFATSTVAITVNPTPDAQNAALTACSDLAGGTTATFNLASANSTVDPSGSYAVTYHTSTANAMSGAAPLSTSYASASGDIYARLANGTTGCVDVSTVSLTVTTLPVANPASQTLCSDDLANDSATFTLTNLNAAVDPTSSYTVSYHETPADAASGANALPNSFKTNSITIYARVANGVCVSTSPVTLTVNATPAAIAATSTACSDIAGGNTAIFNLAGLIATIDTSGSYVVTFHTSQINANQDLGAVSQSYMTGNTTLYARVENGTTGCFSTNTVGLTVVTTPAANSTSSTLCASTAGGTTAMFDLAGLNATVDPTGTYVVTYHASQLLANTDGAALPSPYTSGDATIYARVENGTSGCFTTATIDLNVTDVPVASPASITLCSTSPEGNVADFDLTSLDNTVDPTQSYIVTYHTTQTNADGDVGLLSSPFTSPTQTIYARVENGTTGCYSTSAITLTVITTPAAYPAAITLCENAPNSGVADFDLTSVDATVDPTTNYVVTYHADQNDADADQGALANPYNTGSTTVFARVENGTSNCYSTSTVTLTVVTQTPPPVLKDTAEVCGEDSPFTMPFEDRIFLDSLILSGPLPGDPVWTTTWYDVDGAFGAPGSMLAGSNLRFNVSQLGNQYRFAYVVTGIGGGSCGDQSDTLVIKVIDCFYSVGNQVFFDTNNNGTREIAETGIDGVVMALYNADALGNPTGSLLALDTTKNGGYYVFTILPEGDYVVAAANVNFGPGGTLEGYLSSGSGLNTAGLVTETAPVDPDNDLDDDDNGEKQSSGLLAGFAASQAVSLGGVEPTVDTDDTGGDIDNAPDDQANYTLDFGFYRMELGNIVFEDLNNNGLFEPAAGDTGIANITVRLYDNFGNEILVGADGILGTADDQPGGVMTAADGKYFFTGLPEGIYSVALDLPAGYASSSGTNGSQTGPYEPAPGASTNLLDDDNGTQTGMLVQTDLDTLDAGFAGNALNNTVNSATGTTTDSTIGFGLYRPHSLGNFVWFDLNNNSEVDPGEQPIDGVAISLYKDDGLGGYILVDRDTTQSGGYYLFTYLSEGDYVAVVDADNFASGNVLEHYVSSASMISSAGVASEAAAADPNTNASLTDDNGTLATTGLWAGGVATAVVTLGDVEPTGEPTPTLGRPDMSPDDQANYSLGFGFYTQTLAGSVWNDGNNSGLFEGTESGIGMVRVELYSGDGNTFITAVTTDGSGVYTFEGLAEGDYVVKVLPPDASFVSSSGTNGSITGPYEPGADPELVNVDNDDNGSTGTGANGGFIVSLPITLTPGSEVSNDANTGTTSNDYVDFGLYQPIALGNYVWMDDDGSSALSSTSSNGMVDSGEAAIDGVALSIYSENDLVNPVLRDTTRNGGFYIFNYLAAGKYVVAVDPGNFQAGGALEGLISTDPSETAADGGLDQNDNGLQNTDYPVNGVVSSTLDLMVGGAPTGESPVRVGATTVADTSAYLNVDFGFVGSGVFGNLVWEDLDRDGLQSIAEPGVQDVVVNLYRYDPVAQTGTFIETMKTDVNGKYLFTNLLPNRQYYVEFDSIPANYAFTPKDILGNTGNSDSLDSDVHAVTGLTIPTLISANEQDTSWDAGLYLQQGIIGDLVWIDEDEDGIQDPLEVGLAGVDVYLFHNGQYIDTVTTDPQGRYTFRNVLPGTYRVQFDLTSLPADYVASPSNQGVTDASDSDADPNNGFTSVITLGPDQVDLDWDLGVYIPRGSIGSRVWIDLIGNNAQDVGEPGFAGVTVYLLDGLGNKLDSTVTDAQGDYLFDRLLPNDYQVQFDLQALPVGYVAVQQNDPTTTSTLDSDGDPITGITSTINLLAGQNNTTIDLGIRRIPAQLGGFVWDDLDRNGEQDPAEAGVPNVIVYLMDTLNNVIKIDTTDANGKYFFNGLGMNTYQVFFDDLPATYVVSPQNAVANDSLDSDADVATRVTDRIVLNFGETDSTWDMGIYRPEATLGNYVWEDTNGNGVQDAGESPLIGVKVYLLNAGGTRIDSINTNTSGNYAFDGLLPGDYGIEVVPPAGYSTTSQAAGGDNVVDSDIDPVTGISQTVSLIVGQVYNDLDAGFYEPVSIGDFVWDDANADGLQTGESGLEDVVVVLLDGNGLVVAKDTTDAAGAYGFSDLTPGDYTVSFELPTGSVFSPVRTGSDVKIDSDANPQTGNSLLLTLESGDQVTDVDAGMYTPVSIGDFVWEDLNNNDLQDASELGIAGVVMTLLDGSGQTLATDTTDVNGAYGFDNLLPGSYQVVVTPPNGYFPSTAFAGNDNEIDSDFDKISHSSPIVSLVSGEMDSTLDAGFVPAASIGDFVWEDVVVNGIQDAVEKGIPGAVVKLLDPAGQPIATDTTDANGGYLFENLEPGVYSIEFETPSGYQPTLSSQGFDREKDSDPFFGGRTFPMSLLVGQHITGIDAGFTQPFDLAMIKILAAGQASQVLPGDTITYTMVVFNQGNGPATNVTLVDYIPAQSSLLDPAWTLELNGTATYILPGPIMPGATDSVDITLVLDPFIGAGNFRNTAEIFKAEDQNGLNRFDMDGSFDNNPTNDGPAVDNTILSPLDEDNHDIEDITIANPPCVTSCELGDFLNGQHSFLFTSGTHPGTDATYQFANNTGRIERYTNGSAHIIGTLENKSNPTLTWEVDVWLVNARDWGAWSAAGGGFKIGQGVQRTLFQTWDYYEVDSIRSRLIGQGNLTGDTLFLSHNPVDRSFGFQYGAGANSFDSDLGLSGWFAYTSASGNYTGYGDFINDLSNCSSTCAPAPANRLAISAILQGAYSQNAGQMRTALNSQNVLPVSQPFNVAPWNYAGSEAITGSSMPHDSIVDWLLIEIRDTADTRIVLDRFAALLLHDGTVAGMDGHTLFPVPQAGSFYLSVQHRNHLGVLTAQPVPTVGTTLFADLTQVANVYVNPVESGAPSILVDGKAMLLQGDETSDNQVNSLDLGGVMNQYFTIGNKTSDINLDGVTNSLDVARSFDNYFRRSHIPR